jgi:translation initiation factor IF-2
MEERVANKSEVKRQIEIPSSLTVKSLAELLEISAIELIKQLMRNGVMASINQVIDYETAAVVAVDFGHEPQEYRAPRETTAAKKTSGHWRFQDEDSGRLEPRPPVVTIMGHVDHGKTKLLDAIRQTNVAATEAGGITQHIGAYQVEVNGNKITFLDTPGHEAFTAMRARGAQSTDIAVLVIAADDGVMLQTTEAIAHAQAADVPIIVAINKMDKPNANPDRVKQQLADLGLLIEEWGGDVIFVPVSAKMKEGITELLENILIVAEMAELKADPYRPAVGVLIEAELDKNRGPLATILVQTGTFKVGDTVVVGNTWGKVKAMFDDKGKHVKKAGPSSPVEILGLNSIPQAGDILTVVADERRARSFLQKLEAEKQQAPPTPKRPVTLDDVFTQISGGQVKELDIILKTDVQGSIDPIKSSLEQLEMDKAKAKVIHSAPGSITENDVLLALVSKGIIIGFNTRVEPGAHRLADLEGVDVRHYEVIYNLVDDVEKALKGMLEPTYVEVIEGHAEVRSTFPIEKKGKVAGVYVADGKVSRSALARVVRDGQGIHESTVNSLRRFKDDVKEVTAGFECGVGLEGFTDFQIGDIIELFRKERQKQ